MEARVQPHSIEHEEGIIACCLNSADAQYLDSAIECGLKASDFYKTLHQAMFSAMLDISKEGKSVDECSLLEHAKKSGQEIEIQDIYQIQGRVEVPSVEKLKGLCDTVIEHSKLRNLIKLNRLAIEDCYESVDSGEIMSRLENEIIHIGQDECEDDTISRAAESVENDLKSMMAGTYERKGLRFGIDSVDEQLPHGLENGTVTVVAAPSSCGKTQVALNCLLKNSITNGLPCADFSYEMPATQLARRMLQTASGVNLEVFRNQSANSEQQRAVAESIKKLKESTILTNHNHKTVDCMASLARQWKRKHDIKLLVIDYLQRMDSPNHKMSSVESVTYNSRKIKDLALELDIPILELSQVNREAVKRLEFNPEKGLLMHDLIGASAIECDSDNILIFWPENGDPEASRMRDVNYKPYLSLRGQFAKQREGTRGVRFSIKFIEQTGRFS